MVRALVVLAAVAACERGPNRRAGSEAGVTVPPGDGRAIDAEVYFEGVEPPADPHANTQAATTDDDVARRPFVLRGADLIGPASTSAGAEVRAEIADKLVYGESSSTIGDLIAGLEREGLSWVAECYEGVLAGQPARPRVSGSVIASFAIDARGRASEPSVKAFDQELANCALAVVKAWRFPKPARARTARYTLKIALAVK
jgi:hypothetical protein